MSVFRALHARSRMVSHIIASVWGYAAFIVSRFETGQKILSIESGEGAPEQLGSRTVIFVHFDSARLATADHAWVRRRAARIVIRRNLGYDFAAWRDAMETCCLPAANTDLLVLANDSVYGPLYPLKPVLDQIDFEEADVWSATDSWQHRFHLQSFFLAFGPRALGQDAFGRFWHSVGNVRSKQWVVQQYEVGLSRSLITAGLRCKAIWSYLAMIEVLRYTTAQDEAEDEHPMQVKPQHQLNDPHCINHIVAESNRRILRTASRRIPLNPMADLWRVLLAQGCPFLKRELLRDNPTQVPDVAAWSSVLGRIEGYGRDIVLRDLEKSLRNRSP